MRDKQKLVLSFIVSQQQIEGVTLRKFWRNNGLHFPTTLYCKIIQMNLMALKEQRVKFML